MLSADLTWRGHLSNKQNYTKKKHGVDLSNKQNHTKTFIFPARFWNQLIDQFSPHNNGCVIQLVKDSIY